MSDGQRFTEFEAVTTQRRRVLRALGVGAAMAITSSVVFRATAALAATAANKVFPVTTVNHLSYASLDYKKTRDFYVDVLGMRVVWDDGTKCQVDFGPEDAPNTLYLTTGKPGTQPTVGHFSFGLPDYWARADQLRDELTRRGLPGVHPDGEAGWFVSGPSGYTQHIVTVKDAAMFPGAAEPCKVARSETCKDAYAIGLKNLDSIPKASGRGSKALYFKYIVLHVPDVAKERDFYTSLMGMKIVSETENEVALRFGENTLVLRATGASAKPYCNEFGFVVENLDQTKVKADLDRRGIASQPNPFGGLALKDPNGLVIGIAG
jgi:catechol 2,3-dioxygenase-like lactoylglutathione lyase family enzyme